MTARILAAACAASVLVQLARAAEDWRPPFDKSDWLGRVNVQVNPWFGLDKQPLHAKGGPNAPWTRPSGVDPWEAGMALTERYGVDTWSVELSGNGGWAGTYRALLDASARRGGRTKIAIFFNVHAKSTGEAISAMKKTLSPFREDLKSNPCVARAGGFPVVLIYGPHKFEPGQWTEIFNALDAEFGRMVYLANYRRFGAELGAEHFERELRRYLPRFDGVSNYGSHGIAAQRVSAEVLARVMRESPGKIFEAGMHSTYTCHFHMGGLEVHNSEEWRASVDLWLSAKPDSYMLTNLFDHYENSLVYPCYEREDLLLRYLECALAGARKERTFRREKRPELVVVNPNTLLVGWQNLEIEVLGFPVESSAAGVVLRLRVCDTAGKTLRAFPPRQMKLDGFRSEKFSLPSSEFAAERGIVPILDYDWKGKARQPICGQMTRLSPSIRDYRMYWARSTKNQLSVKGSPDWTLDGVHPGETRMPAGDGVFESSMASVSGGDEKGGYFRCGIRRDGLEYDFTTEYKYKLDRCYAVALPSPGAALHWYTLQMENARGCKVETLPVWESDGTRSAIVRVPVWKEDGTIADFDVEEARVPFWHYPCDRDTGRVLLDVSGYRHNGNIDGTGFGGGHLCFQGYNHYHNGPAKPVEESRRFFGKDGDGRGFLRLGGKDYVVIMGGTAFPGACTYELSVRPSAIGSESGLVGTGNGQMSIDVLADGRVKVSRRGAVEGAGGVPLGERKEVSVVSRTPLAEGKWTRMAAVYDLRTLSLYVDGRREGEARSAPVREHEWETHVILGAKCSWVWNPVDNFKGDVRDVRIYGRNLSPSEFLKVEPIEIDKVGPQ
ncbi:MAG: hypothetical protein IJG84_15050 [Kiritimatiellae bacterium]|nr:hypothetical protein [Kiritimatiellia bacterium]